MTGWIVAAALYVIGLVAILLWVETVGEKPQWGLVIVWPITIIAALMLSVGDTRE